MKRRLRYTLLGVLAAALAAYGLDDLIARFRSPRFETIKVDQVYAIENRWKQVDYSIGKSQMERCINALMPHSGTPPCWYLKSHTLRFHRA